MGDKELAMQFEIKHLVHKKNDKKFSYLKVHKYLTLAATHILCISMSLRVWKVVTDFEKLKSGQSVFIFVGD